MSLPFTFITQMQLLKELIGQSPPELCSLRKKGEVAAGSPWAFWRQSALLPVGACWGVCACACDPTMPCSLAGLWDCLGATLAFSSPG